jgi:plasmid stabilization system protein ParE
MIFSFHPEAEEEFNNAIDYYENAEPGLGYDFAIEAYSTIQRIIEYPKAWPQVDKEIRRSLVQRFPFGMLYSEEGDSIFILAVMHLHKKPGYWKTRKR